MRCRAEVAKRARGVGLDELVGPLELQSQRRQRRAQLVRRIGGESTFLLDEPLRLATRENRPYFQGPLQLLTGPHRVEGGWWHRIETDDGAKALNVQRDYWVALSQYAGTLWIYQERLADDQTAWYLHGCFA